jgi:hypothetical protein
MGEGLEKLVTEVFRKIHPPENLAVSFQPSARKRPRHTDLLIARAAGPMRAESESRRLERADS